MSEVRALIEQLVDAGVDPITAAEVITRAAIAGAKDVAQPEKSKGAQRQARYRERGGGMVDAETRAYVFDRDKNTCQDCGSTDHLCIDHIIPVNRGGDSSPENLQVLCKPCNSKKKDRIRKRDKVRIERNKAELSGNNRNSEDSEQKENTPHTPQKKNNIYTPPIAPPSETRPRGTRLPADWVPEPLPSDFKTKHGLTDEHCANELDQFRDYWASAPGQKGVKLDWQATWRVWLRNSKTNRSRGSPEPPRKSAFQNTMTNLAEIFADEQQAENDRDAVRKLSVIR